MKIDVAVDGLPLGWAAVVERAVKPACVVPTLDVVEDGSVQTGTRWPCSRVDELSFDGGEKTFRHGVGTRRQLRLNPTESIELSA